MLVANERCPVVVQTCYDGGMALGDLALSKVSGSGQVMPPSDAPAIFEMYGDTLILRTVGAHDAPKRS